jgi:hypothetical protein
VRTGDLDSLPRVGGIATMPSRSRSFAAVIRSILPQLDRLYVFFDRRDEIPTMFANEPKIVSLSPAQSGDFHACGKFLGIDLFGDPCLYFCFDDDIQYPPNYVQVVTRALHRFHMRAAVGFQASLFTTPHLSYARDRTILHFGRMNYLDHGVDELGTGTIGLCTAFMKFHPRAWPYHDMADLMFAIEAAEQQIPKITIRRPDSFLKPLEENQADSIQSRLMKDDTRQTAIMRTALETYPLAWQRQIFDAGGVPGSEPV